jgi:hypothetical protein
MELSCFDDPLIDAPENRNAIAAGDFNAHSITKAHVGTMGRTLMNDFIATRLGDA